MTKEETAKEILRGDSYSTSKELLFIFVNYLKIPKPTAQAILAERMSLFIELLPEGPMKEGIDESLAALKPQPETEPLEEPQQQQQPDPDNYREGE